MILSRPRHAYKRQEVILSQAAVQKSSKSGSSRTIPSIRTWPVLVLYKVLQKRQKNRATHTYRQDLQRVCHPWKQVFVTNIHSQFFHAIVSSLIVTKSRQPRVVTATEQHPGETHKHITKEETQSALYPDEVSSCRVIINAHVSQTPTKSITSIVK